MRLATEVLVPAGGPQRQPGPPHRRTAGFVAGGSAICHTSAVWCPCRAEPVEVIAVTGTSLAERLEREGRDELTPAEAEEYAAEQIRHHLGMSVDEFRAKAELDELPDTSAVLHLAMLLGVRLKSC
jgi:hypothetical protein